MTVIRPFPKPLDRPVRLVVLISGGGTTLVNLCDHISTGQLSAEIPLVIASRSNCGGIEKASARGVPCEVISRKSFDSTPQFSEAIFKRCRNVGADLVICGGFLALLKIPADFANRVLNIHPSLIPAFCGHGYHGHAVHEAVLKRGCKFSGCTVHLVDDEYDHGPIVLQRVVPVKDDDTPDSLAARVFAEECLAYPEAIRHMVSGRFEIVGSTTRLS
jgi:formyltetrahydrofolate-dependent phosphoribosylglycinamide formyltransferase